MDNIFKFLSSKMTRPTSYGWFHLLWLGLIILSIIIIILRKNKSNNKELNFVLLFYGITALILEIIKQLIWSYDYTTHIWDYNWYASPFQLCTTPIYASLIAAFTKNEKIKKGLLSYIAFTSILGSLVTIIYPESCFVTDIEVNIHTMFLHCGSFILSIYLIINYIKGKKDELKSSLIAFLVFESIALLLDIIIYKSGILHGETFNMFFISPYFECTLPILNTIYNKVPYILFLLIYNIFIILGTIVIYFVVKYFKKERKHDRNKKRN